MIIKKKIVLFAAVLFATSVFVSCKDESSEENGNQSGTGQIDDGADYVTYVLPKGAEGEIPAWTKSDNTYSIPDLNLHGEASNVTDELKTALESAKNNPDFFQKPKNYILMIGDGMGVSQIVAATQHRGDLIMNELPWKAVANSFTRENAKDSSIITDSGAGGTKISTGYRTTATFAAMDAEGNELLSLSELARLKGKKVGVVTNAELADATPADFTVHSKSRSQGWTKICQMEVLFGADLFMGGVDDSLTNAISSLAPLSGKDIRINTSLSRIIKNWNSEDLMWNLFPDGDKTYGRWNTNDDSCPSLQQQMALSLSYLQKISGDEGFFLMFENTYTDIYGHWDSKFMSTTKEKRIKVNGKSISDNLKNLTGIVNEVKDFDEAVAIALKFVLENPDTVLLITADHETGNMRFGTGWESDIYKLRATSGNHSNQNVPIFAIGYGMNKIDTKNGELFTTTDCNLKGSSVRDNTICGQVFGDLMNDSENSFGGDIETDTRGRARDTFTVSVKEAASSVDFNINLAKLPISKNEYVQFKFKPYSGADNVTIKLSNGKVASYVKSTDEREPFENLKFANCASAAVAETTPLAPAHKHAFVKSSEVMDGWYQVSFKTPADTKYITVHLDGAASAGDVIQLDDFTVQYASTRGYVTVTGDNVTAEKNAN